jgi:hypothetical protein
LSKEELTPGFYPVRSKFGTICLGYGDESRLAPQHRLVEITRFRTCPNEGQAGASLVGWVAQRPYVARTCICNSHNALCNRHGVKPPPVLRAFSSDLVEQLRRRAIGRFVDVFAHEADRWLSRWSQVKQAQIERSRLVDDMRPGDVSTFVKREVSMTWMSKARSIHGYANFATQEAFAREFVAAQKSVFEHHIDLGGGVHLAYASGMNNIDIGQWMSDTMNFGFSWFYERDGKNWDATMQMPHFLVRCGVLVDIVGLVDFMTKCYRVTARGRKGPARIKYKLSGTVKSGHNDTSLGNSLVNAVIVVSMLRHFGVAGRVIVAGDDCLVALKADFDLGAYIAYERAFGIEPVAAKFKHPLDVSFLSGYWWDVEGRYVFTPRLGRVIAKLFATVRPPSRRQANDFLHSICVGMRMTIDEMPIARLWLDLHDPLPGQPLVIAPWMLIERYWLKHVVQQHLPRDIILPQMLARYDLVHTDVQDIELMLLEVSLQPGIIVHPVLQRIISFDVADPTDRWVVAK